MDILELAKDHLIHIFEWNQTNPPKHQVGFLDRDYSHIPFETVVDRMSATLDSDPPRHTGDHLSAAILAYGSVMGYKSEDVRWWVEKTPYNEYYADSIFAFWPLARCVHIMRDPCDNYTSYRRKHASWTPGFFGENWLRSTSAGFANRRKFGVDRYLILRFEDLVLEQESIFTQLRNFLGIVDHPSLRVPSRGGESWEGNSMFEDTFTEISDTPVGRWRKVLPARDAALVQLVTKRFRRKLGYKDESPKKLEDFIQALYWRSRRVFYDAFKRGFGG